MAQDVVDISFEVAIVDVSFGVEAKLPDAPRFVREESLKVLQLPEEQPVLATKPVFIAKFLRGSVDIGTF